MARILQPRTFTLGNSRQVIWTINVYQSDGTTLLVDDLAGWTARMTFASRSGTGSDFEYVSGTDTEIEITNASAREVTYTLDERPSDLPTDGDSTWWVGVAIENSGIRHLWANALYTFKIPLEGPYAQI